MNFDFSDDQRVLRDHARRFLSEMSDLPRLRETLASGETYDRQLWQQVTAQGWQGVAIAEAQGGLGLGMLELCVLAEELGHALSPVPFFSTVCLGAELLKRCPGNTSEQVLQGIVNGEAILAAGLVTPQQDWLASLLDFRAGMLCGQSLPLAYAAQADYAVLPALHNAAPALVLIKLQQEGVTRNTLNSLDEIVPFARLNIDTARAELLCEGEEALQVMTQVVNQAAVLTAFEQIGGAEAALAISREYALDRHTFGRPIGSYQAVKHRLADMTVKIELARSNAFYGAWAMHAGTAQELAAAAALSRLSASEAFTFAAEECLHLHGGIGYTWEADCHFFYKRARLLAVSVGGSDAWVDRLLTGTSLQTLHS